MSDMIRTTYAEYFDSSVVRLTILALLVLVMLSGYGNR